MANPHGTPIWYEYLGRDIATAQAFYAEVVGWRIVPSGMPGMDYRLLTAPDGDQVGGMMAPPGDPPAGWFGYVGVDDVDATVAAIEAAGGSVAMPAMTIEGVGRLAMVADPQGAVFYVMRGASDESSRSFTGPQNAAPGHFVWNELIATDQDAAMAFYAQIFGWRHEGAMPMGPMGDYKFIQAGALAIGASMNAPPGEQRGWRSYTMVDDIDAAVGRLTRAGGTVIQGPDLVPGNIYALFATDPLGALFGLVGPRL